MNTMQQGVTAILKSAVTAQPQPLPKDFDFADAVAQLHKHHMSPILYTGAVLCGIPPQEETMRRLFGSYCKSLLISERQMEQVSRIYDAFQDNGIDHMPLKGCVLKQCYPKPELRMMGDADILIRTEQYNKIRPVLEKLGFHYRYESDHEIVWQNDSLFLELHKRLIPSYNEDYSGYFSDGWQLARRESGCRYSMKPEDTFLFLFTHFCKHFRDGGAGCRYVLDLWVYLRSEPAMDLQYISDGIERLGLQTFYENTRKLLDVWFHGVDSDELTDSITDYIFSSGSWGDKESRLLSNTVRISGSRKRNGKLAYMKETLFPGLPAMRGIYKVLEKAPWLLPVIWLWRLICKLVTKPGGVSRFSSMKRNMQVISDEKLNTRRAFLRYVGLEYNK